MRNSFKKHTDDDVKWKQSPNTSSYAKPAKPLSGRHINGTVDGMLWDALWPGVLSDSAANTGKHTHGQRCIPRGNINQDIKLVRLVIEKREMEMKFEIPLCVSFPLDMIHNNIWTVDSHVVE